MAYRAPNRGTPPTGIGGDTYDSSADKLFANTFELFTYLKCDPETGILPDAIPVSRGGTGADNAEDARANLDVYSKSEVESLVTTGGEGNVVGVAGGGTGADNAEDARANLDVYSKQEVDLAIDEAVSATTPLATESVAGKAKIATTTIAQEGVNDTDFLTAKKLKNTVFGLGQSRKVVAKISGTTYTNTTGKPIGFEVIFKSTANSWLVMDINITVNSEIRQRSVMNVGDTNCRCSMFVIVLPNESYSFNAVTLSSIEKVTEIS